MEMGARDASMRNMAMIRWGRNPRWGRNGERRNATGDGNLLRHVANRVQRRKDAAALEHLLAEEEPGGNLREQLGGENTIFHTILIITH
jgi:hypothetical protein